MHELMSYKCIDFKKLLLIKAKQLNIKDDESHLLLIVMTLTDLNIKPINPYTISEYSSLTIKEIDQLVIRLLDAHLLERNNGSLNIQPTFNKLLEVKEEEVRDTNLIEAFEEAFSRTLSSYDLTIIESFKSNGYSDEMILDALNEAVKSNVFNFRYIEKILMNWSKNGVKKRFARVEKPKQNVDEEVKNYKWWDHE